MIPVGQQTFGIDHPLITVKDHAKVLQDFYLMGFNASPISYHPWGTVTSNITFPGNFIEIIGIDDPSKYGANSVNGFCFGRQIGAFLDAGHEGISLIALHSKDADQDNQFLEQQGLIGQGRIDFRRKMKLPDGTPDEAIVSLGLFIDEQNYALSNFICHQHRPELIWVKDWQKQPNGVDQITQITFVGDLNIFKERWNKIYPNRVCQNDQTITVDTGCGVLKAITLEAASQEYLTTGLPEGELNQPRAIAIQVRTKTFDVAKKILKTNNVEFFEDSKRLLVAPKYAGNTILEFIY
ncbi:VOC family protein [Acinetobacter pittii]|uniref:VOC family protein n=1 Tax=Acinetobacter pittii TaxID=48296 RepID=UPI0019826B5D|nr:VOC family protein [Acinetobacter pittii]MBN6523280.1 VOC family protein [Acinetobacter pittii]